MYLNVNQVSKRLGIRRETLWCWRESGRFPEPDYSEGRCQFWKKSVIDTWVKDNPVKKRAFKKLVVEMRDNTAQLFDDISKAHNRSPGVMVEELLVYAIKTPLANDIHTPVGWDEIEAFSGVLALDDVMRLSLDCQKAREQKEGYRFVIRHIKDGEISLHSMSSSEVMSLWRAEGQSSKNYRVVRIETPEGKI